MQPGYWEETWPRLQIEAARYGLSGGAGLGSLFLLNFSMSVSTFLVEFLPFSWHAASGATGGVVSCASVAALVAAVDRLVSLDPNELRRHCFETVRRDFFIERALGGAVTLGPAMTSSVTPAELYLVERKTPGFLKDYAFRPGSVEIVFRVDGPAGGAVVVCEGVKAIGTWKLSKVVVQFESALVPEDKRVLVLTTNKSETPHSPLQRSSALLSVSEQGSLDSASPVLKLRNFWDAVLLRY